MKMKTILFGRTLSDGNYGGHKGEVSIELEDGECEQAAMNKAKAFVLKNLNDDILQESQPELPIEKEEEKVEEKPKSKPRNSSPKKKAAKKVAKKVTKKAANVVYDRALQPHKTMFLAMASELGLRKGLTPEDKKALRETSEFMEGQEMFEAGSTDILESFKEMAAHNFKDFKDQFSAEA